MTTTEVARPKRGRESVSDMARSLGLVVVVLAATLIFVPGLFHPSKSQRFHGVNFAEYLVGFRQLTGRAAFTPIKLPGWKATGAALTGTKATAHLHVGWATPGGKYAGLEESVGPPAPFISSILGKVPKPGDGTVVLRNITWQTLRSTRGEYSLTQTTNGITVVITGSATATRLLELALSLQQ